MQLGCRVSVDGRHTRGTRAAHYLETEDEIGHDLGFVKAVRIERDGLREVHLEEGRGGGLQGPCGGGEQATGGAMRGGAGRWWEPGIRTVKG